MIMKKFYMIGAVAAGIMTLTSCGCSNKAVDTAKIDGEWRIEEVMGISVAGKTEESAVINFDTKENKVSGTAGCNRFMGSFKLGEEGRNSIKFSPLAATKMMCPDMEIEDKFFRAVDAARTVKVSKSEMSLRDADGKPVVKLAR